MKKLSIKREDVFNAMDEIKCLSVLVKTGFHVEVVVNKQTGRFFAKFMEPNSYTISDNENIAILDYDLRVDIDRLVNDIGYLLVKGA